MISFRFFVELEGLHKCYFAEFKRLDKFFIENSTLLVTDDELIIDTFKYCVNINSNLLGHRDIEISNDDLTTSRIDTDVVMQESSLPRVSETLESSFLVNLILLKAETQMDNWGNQLPQKLCKNFRTLIMKVLMSQNAFLMWSRTQSYAF